MLLEIYSCLNYMYIRYYVIKKIRFNVIYFVLFLNYKIYEGRVNKGKLINKLKVFLFIVYLYRYNILWVFKLNM